MEIWQARIAVLMSLCPTNVIIWSHGMPSSAPCATGGVAVLGDGDGKECATVGPAVDARAGDGVVRFRTGRRPRPLGPGEAGAQLSLVPR